MSDEPEETGDAMRQQAKELAVTLVQLVTDMSAESATFTTEVQGGRFDGMTYEVIVRPAQKPGS